MIFSRLSFALAHLGACSLLACSSTASPTIELYDPLGLADVSSELRLLVFPSDARSCNADGTLGPDLGEDEGAEFMDAVVDLRLGNTERSSTVNLDEGSYVVSIRGWGTDPVTGRMNVLVARGCAADVVIASGETREINLMIQNVEGMGMCADGVLSPDEQCEMATGPLPCNASCQTESQVAHSTVLGAQSAPTIGWTAGGRMVVAFESTEEDGDRAEPRAMLRGEDGQAISSPAFLEVDFEVDRRAGVQADVAAAMSPARLGIAFTDVGVPATTGGGDVMVRFFDPSDAMALTPSVLLSVGPGSAQGAASIAMLTDGTALVVFEDPESGSGLTGALIAAGGSTATSVSVGGGGGASAPSVAAIGSNFVVAYEAAGGVRVERVSAAGAALGEPTMVDASGASVNVGGLSDGRFLVTWVGGGTVRARAFDGTGTPMETHDVGAGAAPVVAAGGGRYIVAYESGGNVLGRYLDSSGAPSENRENPRTRDAFTIGAGTAPAAAVGGGSPVVAAFVYAAGGDIQQRLLPLP